MVGVMVMANANKAQSLFRCVYNTPKWNKEWVPTYSGDRFGKGLPKAITGRKGVITMDSTAETQNITLAINISTKKKRCWIHTVLKNLIWDQVGHTVLNFWIERHQIWLYLLHSHLLLHALLEPLEHPLLSYPLDVPSVEPRETRLESPIQVNVTELRRYGQSSKKNDLSLNLSTISWPELVPAVGCKTENVLEDAKTWYIYKNSHLFLLFSSSSSFECLFRKALSSKFFKRKRKDFKTNQRNELMLNASENVFVSPLGCQSYHSAAPYCSPSKMELSTKTQNGSKHDQYEFNQ